MSFFHRLSILENTGHSRLPGSMWLAELEEFHLKPSRSAKSYRRTSPLTDDGSTVSLQSVVPRYKFSIVFSNWPLSFPFFSSPTVTKSTPRTRATASRVPKNHTTGRLSAGCVRGGRVTIPISSRRRRSSTLARYVFMVESQNVRSLT